MSQHPIADLRILEGNARAPSGWEKIPVDLNDGAGGSDLYLAYKRSAGMKPITEIDIVMNSSTPSGWAKLSTDLNKGAGGEDLFLVFRRGTGRSILAITVVNDIDKVPHGYTIVNRDLNKGAGGQDLYLAYMLDPGAYLEIQEIKCVHLEKSIVTTTADQVYIKVNGEKVWPRASKYVVMWENDVKNVNLFIPYDREVVVEVMEWDKFSDDTLERITFDPGYSQPIVREHEHPADSRYEIVYRKW